MDRKRKLELLKVNTNTDNLNHPLLPYIEVLGLYIRLYTSYQIEISSIDDDNDRFFQIDEHDNKFYFSFFIDRLEFAFGNFNNCETITWNTLLATGYTGLECKLRNMGAPESLVEGFQHFICFLFSS